MLHSSVGSRFVELLDTLMIRGFVVDKEERKFSCNLGRKKHLTINF